jgi:hypothetical protein
MRLLALFLTLALSASAADVHIVRVFTGWRDAGSFKRISEYFTGRENTGGQIVLRSQPAERGGYYFLVRTENKDATAAAQFRLQVVLPGSHQPRVFNFPVEIPGGQQVFNIGVTGSDWPDSESDAVAWKLDVLDATGALLASEKSYLWEKPAAN